jgi:Tfp pilus assembly protein PilV
MRPNKLVAMPTSTGAPHFKLSRAGLTVVEVLIALMLVSIGMLGIAGSTTLALRTAHDAAHRRAAAQRIESRFAQLSAMGCARATAGAAADSARSISERWSVSAAANGFTMLADSVSWMSARGRISFVLTSAIVC